MNARWFSLLAVALLALGLSVLPSTGQTGEFIITNADATNYLGLVDTPDIHIDPGPRVTVQYANGMQYYAIPPVNAELLSLLQQVGPKFTVQYANGMQYYPIPPVDPELPGLLQQVGPKFTIQYANGMKYYAIPPVNEELQSLLQQVPPKFTLQYANADKYYSLGYPVELIADSAPPQISGLTVRKTGGNVLITWTTDELATTLFRFGTTSGNLTQEVTDATFSKAHQVSLGGLANGMKYYYTIRHIDRSGNVFQSTEYSFTINVVFIPFIRR